MEDQIEQMQEQEEVVEKKPKKSKAGRIILIVLLIFLLALGGGAFWVYRKVSSMTKPVDLGVEYTVEDYNELAANLGHNIEAEKLCFDCAELTFSNPQEVDVVVTNSQASAAFDMINEKLSYGKVSNTQIRFGDNMAEGSTVFTYNGKDYPVYLSGNIEKASDKTVSIELFDLKASNINLPSGVKNLVEETFVSLANERLAIMGDTFRIDDGKLTEEGLHFDGMIPTVAE